MDKILDNKELFNNYDEPRLVGKSLRELMDMKKGADEEFDFCAYVGTTMQLLDMEFLRWLLERGAQPANLSKLIWATQARKEAGTFWARARASLHARLCRRASAQAERARAHAQAERARAHVHMRKLKELVHRARAHSQAERARAQARKRAS